MTPEELLDHVNDRDSFVAFVEALAADRQRAEAMERAEKKSAALKAFIQKSGTPYFEDRE